MWIHNALGIGILFIFELVNCQVDALLKILPSKEKQIKFVGESFFVTCEATGRNVQRVMWTGPDDKQITNYLKRIHVEDGKYGQKGMDLFFEAIDRKDRGNYTCSANVDGKEVKKYFSLIVLKPISFDRTEKVQFLEEGSDSPIRCNVDGDPKPRVNWRYNGKSITTDNIDPKAKYTNHPENKFWIVVKNATINDGGKYTCAALQLTQATSEFKLQAIDVKVRHRPIETKTQHMNESYSYVSGIVNLTCAVIAEPSPNFTWIKDGKDIKPSQDIKIFNEDQRSILQLKVLNDKMFGDYYCKAQNRLGILERVVTLEKGVKPATPEAKIKAIKAKELHLNLHSKGHADMPITGFRVEFKMTGKEWHNATSKEFKIGEPYILDGLKANTLYVMRVSSMNAAGYSDPSKDMIKRTKKLVSGGDQFSGTVALSDTVPVRILVISFLSLSLAIVS